MTDEELRDAQTNGEPARKKGKASHGSASHSTKKLSADQLSSVAGGSGEEQENGDREPQEYTFDSGDIN